MKTQKNNARDQRTSKPRIKDLPVSDARAKGTKGGLTSSVSNTLDGMLKATTTVAQKV